MLQAGADVLLRNTSGEAPLYIAALRGEDRVVDVLLQHMQSEGICWQVCCNQTVPTVCVHVETLVIH